MKISLVIPALNVEDSVGQVIEEMKKSALVDEIIIVDNNSTDRTFDNAKCHDVRVLRCHQQGLGFAMKAGIQSSHNDLVMKVDSDIRNPNPDWVSILFSALLPNLTFVNGIYDSDYDEYPVGTLVARPALRIRYPNLEYVKMPLSGIYLFRKESIDLTRLPNNWAFDLSMLLMGHEVSGVVGQTKIGPLHDKPKMIIEYQDMAFEIMEFIFSGNNQNGGK